MNYNLPFEDYTIEEEIGCGAYGTVLRVRSGDAVFAVKRIFFPETDEKTLQNEITILDRLKNEPNIVSIRDSRILKTGEGYEVFLLMDDLEPLSSYETTHPMDEAGAIRLGLDILKALKACEQHHILHRDLKPDNILVSAEGTFYLCDFGEAKLLQENLSTQTVKGTFLYMAPEVYHGEKYDHRADLYSLGILLYRIVNRGKEPFLQGSQRIITAKDREEALNKRMNGEVLPPPDSCSEAFAEILSKACAYYPDKRYPDADAFEKDLQLLKEGRYRVKKKKRTSYGKLRPSDYLKRTARICAGALLLVLLFFPMRYLYREHFVNYCDTELQQKLKETYNVDFTARLDGNGVLTINDIHDLFCSEDGSYPWALQKDRIKKIVFGKEMTGYENNALVRSRVISFRVPSGSSPIEYDMAARSLRVFSSEIFNNLRNLKEVVIESPYFRFYNIISFKGCVNLEKITCPEDARIVLDWDCEVLSDTAWYQKEGFRILGTTLIRYNGDRETIADIPENIELIEDNAFSHLEGLKSITLPDHVTQISRKAFEGCRNLETVKLPPSLLQIGAGAFLDCALLDHVSLPESLQDFNGDAFRGCSSLVDLQAAPGNPAVVLENGILYTADKSQLLWCSPSVTGTLTIPESVTSVYTLAFYDAANLSSLVIPESMQVMPGTLFGLCPALEDIRIAENNPAFHSDPPLVFSPDDSTVFFCERDAEELPDFPENTKSIIDYAMASCKELKEIVLPENITHIMSNAFENCTNLQHAVLPGTLSFIGNDVFKGCSSLTDIDFEGSKEAWEQLTDRFDLGIDESRTTIHFR